MTNLQDLLNRKSNQTASTSDIDFENWFYGKRRMEKFWECYVEGTDGGRHYHHNSSLESAEKEAERLARLPDNQGKTVYLFQCVGKCKAEPVQVKWEVPR